MYYHELNSNGFDKLESIIGPYATNKDAWNEAERRIIFDLNERLIGRLVDWNGWVDYCGETFRRDDFDVKTNNASMYGVQAFLFCRFGRTITLEDAYSFYNLVEEQGYHYETGKIVDDNDNEMPEINLIKAFEATDAFQQH